MFFETHCIFQVQRLSVGNVHRPRVKMSGDLVPVYTVISFSLKVALAQKNVLASAYNVSLRHAKLQ